jgi:hypothetical protein
LPQTGHVQEALDIVVSGSIVRKGCFRIVVCEEGRGDWKYLGGFGFFV